MGLDASRNPGYYQKPQQPSQYGTPNTNPSYGVSVGPSSGLSVTPQSPNAYGYGGKPTTTTSFSTPPTPTMPTPSAPTGTAPDTDPPLAGPGYNEEFYKTHGQDLLNTPSASEDLYAKGAEGSNPFYDYAQQQALKAINDASSSRGGFNSSHTMNEIGNTVADLRGQQAHELGMLAGQADSGKFGRYDRTEQYSKDAQDALRSRANDAVDRYRGLANDQADKVGGFYGEAGRESALASMEAIQAMLKKSGIPEAEYTKWMNTLFSGLGSAAKLGA